MAASSKLGPKSATLWAYDVGFGDCLLLELGYASATRFVLFDFGTKGASKRRNGAGKRSSSDGPLLKIAHDIEQRIREAKNGTLAAVIATHRHQDHISGFAPGAGNQGPGSVIARLKPGVVVQPWTDTPGAVPAWRGPGKAFRGSQGDGVGLAPGTLRLVQRFAELALTEADDAETRFPRDTMLGIQSAAGNNVSNLPALQNLQSMCPAAKHDYVFAGSRAKNLSKALPGVSVQVLGPPTLHQYDALFKAYAKTSPEYWSVRGQLEDEGAFWRQATGLRRVSADAAAEDGAALFSERYVTASTPIAARWLVARMDRDRGEALFELVRAADAVLNNTSVMLLLKIGTHRLLFPGDAQAEAWAYALTHAKDSAATREGAAGAIEVLLHGGAAEEGGDCGTGGGVLNEWVRAYAF